VTLLTDKEQAIPVQVLRSGLRTVAYGRGVSGTLDLRFVAPNADIKVGDVLITSGMDGVYPAGLAVAKVAQLENVGAGAFGRVICQPLAGVNRNRQLLIVMTHVALPPRPPEPAPVKPGAASKRNLPNMKPLALPTLKAPDAPLPAAVPAADAARAAGKPLPSPVAGVPRAALAPVVATAPVKPTQGVL